jgi:hypothetical protein
VGKKERRQKWPKMVIDEHLPPRVAGVFRGAGYRTIEAARTNHFKGRPDLDYLAELRAMNGIFVTSDSQFVLEQLPVEARHAGIILLPPSKAGEDQQVWCAEDAAEVLVRVLKDGDRRVLTKAALCYLREGVYWLQAGEYTLLRPWDTSAPE